MSSSLLLLSLLQYYHHYGCSPTATVQGMRENVRSLGTTVTALFFHSIIPIPTRKRKSTGTPSPELRYVVVSRHSYLESVEYGVSVNQKK